MKPPPPAVHFSRAGSKWQVQPANVPNAVVKQTIQKPLNSEGQTNGVGAPHTVLQACLSSSCFGVLLCEVG